MTDTPPRVHYLDWLRVVIVLSLVPFHCAMLFAPYAYWLRNNVLNPATQALVIALDQFNMETLFFVAGAATWFSLGRRTGREYMVERIKRLFVPIVFGMLVLVPLNSFISKVHTWHRVWQGRFPFDTTYLQHYSTFLGESLLPFQKSFRPGVLWFIWYLIFYTLVLLPLFLYIRRSIERGAGQRLLARLTAFFERRGALFLLVIPLALLQIYPPPSLLPRFPTFYYPVFFIYGFLLYSDSRFERGIEKSGPIALVGGVIAMTLVLLIIFPTWRTAPLGAIYWRVLGGAPGTLGYVLHRLLNSLDCWFWIIGLLYLGKKSLNFSNRFLRYGNEAALPFYIMHDPFIVLIGFYVLPLKTDVLLKYVIATLAVLVATAGFYDVVIRRANAIRVLYGMRLKPKAKKIKALIGETPALP